jgi:hypothetical protein
MRKLLLLAGAAAVAFALAGTAALAQSPAKSKAPATTRSAVSLECSRQADAKGLHGKARRSFRSRCRRDMERKKI